MKIEDITNNYIKRSVDSRMIKIIDINLIDCESILDIGCGSGLYGKYLSRIASTVIGLDYDKVLCENAKLSGYTDVINANIYKLDEIDIQVDGIFCSEVLEHINNQNIESVIDNLCSKARNTVVITVPNPYSPHFKYDPTHILKYNPYSFLKLLNSNSNNFKFKMLPIGFSQYNLEKGGIFKFLNTFSSRIAFLSPTILYVAQK